MGGHEMLSQGHLRCSGMQEAIYREALPAAARAIHLERSKLGNTAGVQGAALSVIDATLNTAAVEALLTEAANRGRFRGVCCAIGKQRLGKFAVSPRDLPPWRAIPSPPQSL